MIKILNDVRGEIWRHMNAYPLTRVLVNVSDLMIFLAVTLSIISKFVMMGGLIDALLYYVFFALFIFAFAGKKYAALTVMFTGNMLCAVYELSYIINNEFFVYYSLMAPVSLWRYTFSAIANGLLAVSCVWILGKVPRSRDDDFKPC